MRIFNILLVLIILFLNTLAFTQKAEAFSFLKRKKPATVEQTTPVAPSEEIKSEPEAKVSPIEEPKMPPDESFVTKYPPKDLIKKVEIEGNCIIKDEQIMEVVKSLEGTPYTLEGVKADLQDIYNLGYFTKNMKAVPQKTDSGVILKIFVQENVPITSFNIQGNSAVEDSEILGIVNPNIGIPQNINILNDMIDQIEDLYAEKGYTLARVKGVKDEPDGCIDIKIDEGYLDEIQLEGNTKTKDYVIKRNMMTKSGDIYNEMALADDIKRLFGTRAFGNVKRTVSQSEKDPEKYCLKIEVEEKRSGSISLGGGFDTATGVFGTTGFTDYNFRGRGQQFGVDFTTGSGIIFNNNSILKRASYQLETRFYDPYFLQSKNSFQAKAFARDYASWQVPLATERRFGSEVELMHPFEKTKNLSGGITLGFENVNIKEGSASQSMADFAAAGVDFSKRAKMLVGGTFISLGPKLVYDTRDSFIAPREGVYAYAGAKEYFAIGSSASSFGKIDAAIQKYFPVGEKSTLALMGKTGINLNTDAPLFAQYNLGGIRSIRGFQQAEAGNGLGMMMATAEFRTPVPFMDKITENTFFNDMRVVAFLDAGRVLSPNTVNDVYKYPGYGIAAGFGLRVYIPGLGPVKLDYGYPLSAIGGGGSKTGRFIFDVGEVY